MKRSLLFLVGSVCLAAPTLQPYLGSWKGVCADGQDFVVLVLNQEPGGTATGTIRLANMRGGDDGHCSTVVDPPSEKHALAVSDVRVTPSSLTFKGGRRTDFAMSVNGSGAARLGMLGTASEENPWALVRAQ